LSANNETWVQWQQAAQHGGTHYGQALVVHENVPIRCACGGLVQGEVQRKLNARQAKLGQDIRRTGTQPHGVGMALGHVPRTSTVYWSCHVSVAP
jgi:hypothetical protein